MHGRDPAVRGGLGGVGQARGMSGGAGVGASAAQAGTPRWERRFDVAAPGAYNAAAMTAMGWQHSRASVGVWQASATENGVTLAGVDEARIVEIAAGCRGLLVEPAHTNLVHNSRQWIAPQWLAASGGSSNEPSGVLFNPDSFNTTKITCPAAGYYKYWGQILAGAHYSLTLWRRARTGTTVHQIAYGRSIAGGGTDAVDRTTIGTTWERRHLTATGGAAGAWYVCGAVGGGFGFGEQSLAQDVILDHVQVIAGRLPLSDVITTSTDLATCAADWLRSTTATATTMRAGSRLGVLVDVVQLGPLSHCDGTPCAVRWAADDGAAVLTISPSTRRATVTVGGVATEFPTAIPDGAFGTRLELFLAVGGGRTTFLYARSTPSGAAATVVKCGALPAMTLGTVNAVFSALSNAGADHLPGLVAGLATYDDNRHPAWALG